MSSLSNRTVSDQVIILPSWSHILLWQPGWSLYKNTRVSGHPFHICRTDIFTKLSDFEYCKVLGQAQWNIPFWYQLKHVYVTLFQGGKEHNTYYSNSVSLPCLCTSTSTRAHSSLIMCLCLLPAPYCHAGMQSDTKAPTTRLPGWLHQR